MHEKPASSAYSADKPEGPEEDYGSWVASTALERAETGMIPVQAWRLKSVVGRPKLSVYLARMWARRYFILADARARAFQTTRGTLLGKVWLILRPFLDSAVYLVIFGILLGTDRGIDKFVCYLVVGVNFFRLLQSALTQGFSAVTGSINLIRAFSFPRASVVVGWTIRTYLDFLPILVATLLFIVVVPDRALPTWNWLWIIPLLAITFFFTLGLALFTAAITVMLPDMKFIWPLIGRFWFYASGVFFSVERFANAVSFGWVFTENPGYLFLTMARNSLIYNTAPTAAQWLTFGAWTVALFVIGGLLFWSLEEKYAEANN